MKESTTANHKLVFLRQVEIRKRFPDLGNLFSSIHPGILFIIIVAAYSLVVGIGVLIGYQRFISGIKDHDSPLGTEVGAALGLLAFMLGFAFQATWSRFVNRNTYLVTHARVIRTCFLRTSLIPYTQKIECRKLFHEYTNVMLGFNDAPQWSLDRLDELHLLIWKQTASLVHEEMDGELRSIFTGSVNELIDVAMERKAIALFIRIPDAIWGCLLVLAFIGLLAFGYQAGINGMLNIFQLVLLPLAFGIVIVLIANLNSSNPRRHFKVTQKPLKEVLKMMENFDSAVPI